MSRLDLAAERLKAALDRLDRAIVLPSGDDAGAGGRIADLESERERLLARIAALEEELAALSGLTGEVEERLDGAIDEIRAALRS